MIEDSFIMLPIDTWFSLPISQLKADDYLPYLDEKPVRYGNLIVKPLDRQDHEQFVVTKMELRIDENEKVMKLLFIGDNGAIGFLLMNIIAFLRKTKKAPLCVHW